MVTRCERESLLSGHVLSVTLCPGDGQLTKDTCYDNRACN